MHVELAAEAQKQMERLPNDIAIRIAAKLRWYADQADPLSFAIPLVGRKESIYRFRIGDYRAIFIIKKGVISVLFVLAVKHRSQAY